MTLNSHELLRTTSRTFALSIERLPGVVGEAMVTAFNEALAAYPAPEGAGEPDAQVAAQAAEVLAQVRTLPLAVQNQLLVHVRNSTQGMARWVDRGPSIALEDDLDDYMHEVAG